jgi:zinc protease
MTMMTTTTRRRTRMTITIRLSLLLGLALAPPARGSAQTIPSLTYERYTLPNGLEVILHEDHSVPLVAVNTWYKVGSGDERQGRTGFAHLFEHVMFMGSENVPEGQFDVWLEAAGAQNNGSTTTDRTNYYEEVPSNALPLALWLDADRMGWLLPTMSQEKLDLQRDVVKNERRQSYDNQPYGRASETISAALYPPEHPYSWPVIGSMADLSAASLDDVKEFFRRWYAPNNATLAIAGDFDPAEVKALVQRYFGSIPRGPAIERRTTVPPPRIQRDTFLALEDRVQLPRVYYAWDSPSFYKAGDAELDLVARVLAGDKSSRLYKRLVYDMQIAQDVNAVQLSGRLGSTFRIQFTARPGQDPSALARIVDEEVARLLRDGVTDRELQAAKNSFLSGFLDGMASVLGKADQLNQYAYFMGEPNSVQFDADRYAKATAADVQRVARQVFGKPKVVLTVVPQGQSQMMVKGGAR